VISGDSSIAKGAQAVLHLTPPPNT
jgi:hypothetical protein